MTSGSVLVHWFLHVTSHTTAGLLLNHLNLRLIELLRFVLRNISIDPNSWLRHCNTGQLYISKVYDYIALLIFRTLCAPRFCLQQYQDPRVALGTAFKIVVSWQQHSPFNVPLNAIFRVPEPCSSGSVWYTRGLWASRCPRQPLSASMARS